MPSSRPATTLPPDCILPLSVLASYLFFLLRRPISGSNAHYLARRIHGLQSLAPLLDSTGVRDVTAIADSLASLQPANFARVARDLQFRLALVQQPLPIPPDYVVSHRPPLEPLFARARRVLLLLGPAIGIGDEMILFPVPRWLREIGSDIEVTVMSGYPGLWERVNGVHQCRYYSTHREVVDALRGASGDAFDVVMLADFEKPGLISTLCREHGAPTYVELSLGGQYVATVDRRTGRIHALGLPLEARLNYYEALDWLLEWLGFGGRRADRYEATVRRDPAATATPFRVFVSPFTSKHEPSLIYWSRLLGSIGDCAVDQIEFSVDAGVSLSTERFATALMRTAAAQSARTRRFVLAADAGSRTLGLPGVFRELERSALVLCADSYAAHAGPLFGCSTAVIARAGLENWRTPFERSFYFDLEQPLQDVAAAIRRLVERLAGAAAPALPAAAAASLHVASTKLRRRLVEPATASAPAWDGEYAQFTELYSAVVRDLARWPAEYVGLLCDVNYERPWRPFSTGARDEDLDHLRVAFSRWENTNLRKVLALSAAAEVD